MNHINFETLEEANEWFVKEGVQLPIEVVIGLIWESAEQIGYERGCGAGCDLLKNKPAADMIQYQLDQARKEGEQIGREKAEANLKRHHDQLDILGSPMGVSQWEEYGRKYGYWSYFEKKRILGIPAREQLLEMHEQGRQATLTELMEKMPPAVDLDNRFLKNFKDIGANNYRTQALQIIQSLINKPQGE